MANNGNPQQGPAPQYPQQTIFPPDPPQPSHRQATPTNVTPDLKNYLHTAGLHALAVAIADHTNHTTQYNTLSFVKHASEDDNLGSAAWETWMRLDAACVGLFTVISNQGDNLRHSDAENNRLIGENADLRDNLATLQTQLTDLQAQFNTQASAMAAALASGNTTSATKKSLAKDPDSFDASDKDATKRHTAYENWRSKITIRWAQDSHEFPTEHQRILHIAGLLSGPAYQGIRTGLESVLDNNGDPTQWRWQSGTALLETLDATYRNFDVAADAEKKLTLLVQKDDFSNYTDFITEFVSLADRAGVDDATRVRFLRDKVNARIRKATITQIPQPARGDWNGWLKLISALAKNIEHDEFLAESHGNKTGSGNLGNNNNNANPKKDPDAMDLSAARVGGNGGNGGGTRLSPAKLQYRMDNGLCKRCGGAGHIAIYCTPAHRAAAANALTRGGGTQSTRGAPRGAPRGGGRGGRGGYGAPRGDYNGGGRGYNAPAPYPGQAQYPQYPQQYNYTPRPQYGAQARSMTTDSEHYYPPAQYAYHATPHDHNQGYVVGEVQDDYATDNQQGKELPPR